MKTSGKAVIFYCTVLVNILFCETLFEVKDASNNTVLDVSTDGLRIMNYPDTLMIISSSEIRANIDNSKGLSRTFSITTPSSVKGFKDIMKVTADSTRFWVSDTGSGFGVANQVASQKGIQTNLLEVSTGSTTLREGVDGNEYTNFSPENIFLGLNSGVATTPGVPYEISGSDNIFIGNESGLKNVSGVANVYIGRFAGFEGQSSNNCTFLGAGAGNFNTVDNNVFIGNSSGFYSRTGDDNVFIGTKSGGSNNTGHSNVFIGSNAGYGGDQYSSVGTGNDNVFVGDSCAYNSLYGYRNVFLGSKSGINSLSGSGNTFIGYESGYNETGSNKLYISNSDTFTPLIKGTFPNTDLSFTATTINATGSLLVTGNSIVTKKLGVGVSPAYKFHAEDITSMV